ncbi:Uncaracterized surface protein containing fasciclin (FAS1) repeats [Asanoa ishikariensis]|uniref:Uncaracterized surface protein containing fasciclin (FAS1) repeats n=1 Tax=Asanoa ishikariensis TaxID=137265 RepID=A0A1H3R5E1_9ACTN|nr:fasciclin domain-containing protein [Asanoa ishikariensis]SDZ20535.1 Uncaracterized surface protein containing fasciclin (FAS1) repeats [Asanoa ishikariensis]
MRVFRTAGLAVTVAALALAMAACGSDTSPSTALQPTGGSSATSPGGGASGSPQPSGTSTAGGGGQVFGPGCSSLPSSGAGSLSSMASQPVATAVASNPQLSTLANAIKTAGLTDTLNNAQNITVFAPTNDAFNQVGQAQLNSLLANKTQLTQTLEYHVVPQRLSPSQLAGTHKTMEGQTLTVTGSGEDFTVNNTASVVCGNIQTKNATVYLIDGVLTPPGSTPSPAAT